jgi:hypothetical protein
MQINNPNATYLLNAEETLNDKITPPNNELERLIHHFGNKANKAKKNFQFYKYTSIILAAITAIISSLQLIYAPSFPQWILSVVSAGATVAVAFLAATSAQKIWTNSRTTQQQLQAEKFLFNQHAEKYNRNPEVEMIRISSEIQKVLC